MGIGGVIRRQGEPPTQFSEPAGQGTNNEAEYLAVIRALELVSWLTIGSEENILVQSDSKLVVNQVNGEFRINYDHLAKLCGKVRELVEEMPCKVSFVWINREKNGIADALASQAAGTPMAVIKDGEVILWDEGGFQPDAQKVKALPEIKPECQGSIINLVNKGDKAKFGDFAKLRTGGKDKYSCATSSELAGFIETRFGGQAVSWLAEALGSLDTDYGKTVARWVARGLPPDMALKMVSVGKEISANAQKSKVVS